MYGDERPKVKDSVTVDVSQWHSVTGKFEAERYPGSPLLDTNVDLEIPTFCITWEARQKFMEEIAEVIRKYQI